MTTPTISTSAGLREIYGTPPPDSYAVQCVLPHLDQHHRAFIALCPFLVIASADAQGLPDVSPRGDLPGFVAVLDEQTLLIPDRPGNKKLWPCCESVPPRVPRAAPLASPLTVLPYPILRRLSSPRGAALGRPSPWPGALRRVVLGVCCRGGGAQMPFVFPIRSARITASISTFRLDSLGEDSYPASHLWRLHHECSIGRLPR